MKGTDRCTFHTGTDEERQAAQVARAAKAVASREATRAARRESGAHRLPLRTPAELREALEDALSTVRASDASPVEKARVTTAIVDAAARVIKEHDAAAEVKELRSLLAERFPELRTKLRLVK